MRAAIGQMAPQERRGTAFGTFMIVGVAWFLGSALLAVLYDRSPKALVATSLILQLAGIPILVWTMRRIAGAIPEVGRGQAV